MLKHGVPGFLLPIIILALSSLTGFGYVILKTGPEQTSSVIFFLLTLFLSLASVLSVLFFFIHKKFFFRPKAFDAFGPLVTDDDLRPLFRTALRRAVVISALAVALLVLQRLW